MLLSADWVLPVTERPLRDAAVRIRGSHIDDIGPAEDLRRRHPDAREYPHPGCVIVPGLVNAHTHLSLAALGGLLPSAPFAEWVQVLARVMRELSNDDLADSAALGALRCLEAGETVVADVAYGPEALATGLDIGVGGIFFWEVFGIQVSELHKRLSEAEYPTAEDCGTRARCGLTPHSMYTSGPDLLREVARLARETGRPMMLHVAESPSEGRLAATGDGPLAEVAARLAHRFTVPHASPVTYLDRLGVLADAIAVHCVQLSRGDAERLAARTRGVVLCPTSNLFLHNGPPPVAQLREAHARLAVGTYSAASAPDASVIGEARRLAEIDPGLSPEALLRMMTSDGARALGLEERFGSLSRGMQADIAIFRLQAAEDPIASFIDGASREKLEAVLSGGVWRIVESRAAFNARQIERSAERIARRVQPLITPIGPGYM